jgi:hypothetical protein
MAKSILPQLYFSDETAAFVKLDNPTAEWSDLSEVRSVGSYSRVAKAPLDRKSLE